MWEHGGSHGDSLEGDGEHFLEEISSGMNLERKVGILQAKKKEGNLGESCFNVFMFCLQTWHGLEKVVKFAII